MNHVLPNALLRACHRIAGIALLLGGLGQALPAWSALSVNPDGTVRDTTTGLMWDQCAKGLDTTTTACDTGSPQSFTWAAALSSAVTANAVNYKGHGDWRLPNIQELQSVVDSSVIEPSINTTAFPHTPVANFWSATTYAPSPGSAWMVDFYAGMTFSSPSAAKTGSRHVRLVRGGQAVDVLTLTPQTIGFANPGPQNLGTTPTLTATASSGLTPTFASATTGVCTITSAGALTLVVEGTCTINADQLGNGIYAPAPQVTQSFAVVKASQAALTVASTNTTPTYGSTATLSTTGGSGTGAVSFASDSANCTVSATTLTAAAVGNCTITATKAADANYTAATATVSITVVKASQATLTASSSTTTPTYGSTATLNTTGGSGTGVVSFASDSANCTVSATTLTAAAVGNCTITATKAADANYTAATGKISINVVQADQTIVFGPAPRVIVGGTGTVRATGGASGNPIVFASATAGACTVNSSTGVVTGVVEGINNCTITANQEGNANYKAAAPASQRLSIGAADVVVTPPTIPALNLAPNCGLRVWPGIVDLSADLGPSFTVDMVALLGNAVSQALVYLEQSPCGTVTLGGFNGGKLAFIPMAFQSSGDPRADGAYPMGDGRYHVVRAGQSLALAPALVHVEQLVALLPGVAAWQADNGVLTATLSGMSYVVQPGVAAQPITPSGHAQLIMGGDGTWHFIDSLGNNQVLYPAFADPAMLRNVLMGLDANAALAIQLDGTAALVFNGQHYTLAPDLTLGGIPAERVGQNWWSESASRYWLLNLQLQGTVQGLTANP